MLFLLSLLLLVDFSNAVMSGFIRLLYKSRDLFSLNFLLVISSKNFSAFFKSYLLPSTVVLNLSLSKLSTTSFINELKSSLDNLIHNGLGISFNFSSFKCVGCLISDLFLSANDSVSTLPGSWSKVFKFLGLYFCFQPQLLSSLGSLL